MAERQARRSRSPVRIEAKGVTGLHAALHANAHQQLSIVATLVAPEKIAKAEALDEVANLLAPEMISKAEARDGVVPILCACRAEIEMVRRALADGQRQNDALHADWVSREGGVCPLSTRTAVHMMCTKRPRTALRNALLGCFDVVRAIEFRT